MRPTFRPRFYSASPGSFENGSSSPETPRTFRAPTGFGANNTRNPFPNPLVPLRRHEAVPALSGALSLLSSSTPSPVILDTLSCHPRLPLLSSSTPSPVILDSPFCHPRLPLLSSSTPPSVILDSPFCHPRLPLLSSSTPPSVILDSPFCHPRLPLSVILDSPFLSSSTPPSVILDIFNRGSRVVLFAKRGKRKATGSPIRVGDDRQRQKKEQMPPATTQRGLRLDAFQAKADNSCQFLHSVQDNPCRSGETGRRTRFRV